MVVGRFVAWPVAGTLLLGLAVAGCLDPTTPTTTTRPACDPDAVPFVPPERDFFLCYPDEWEKIEDFMGAPVMFLPRDASPIGFTPNLNVYREGDVGDMPVDEYVGYNLQVLAELITDYSEATVTEATLAGGPAVTLDYEGRQGKYMLRYHQVIAIHDGTAYAVTYAKAKDGAGLDPDHLQLIFDSFRFL